MNTASDPGSCKRRCWKIAAIAGLVLFLVLWILTGLGFFSSLLWGVILLIVLGFLLSMMLCREASSDLGSATPPSGAAAAPPASAPPAAKAEPEPPTAAEPSAPAAEADPSASAAAAEPAAAASSASVAASDSGSPLKPSTDLPGQRDLETRKGAWRYDGGDGSAPASASTSASTSAAAAAPAHGAAQAPAAASAPTRLDGPRDGAADDLKLIKGVGPKMETLLHSMGFYHFDQIAAWTADEVAWVDNNLEGFKGRVSRDKWVDQAKALAAGEETEFAQRAKKDGRYD